MALLRNAPSVLLVVSSDDDRLMYAQYLRFTGFTPVECPTTDAALAQAPNADIIVTGIRVQGSCDGIELIRRLRADPGTAHKPLIVLTACVLEHHRTRAQQAGCDAFLPKPCLPDMLVAEIKHVLASREKSC
jgi:two-component system cell cycle response regulator DivK